MFLMRLLLLVLIAAGLLTGCGSSSSSSSSTSSSSSRDAARVKFTQCLRDNGVNIPDRAGGGTGGPPQNVDRSKLQAATKACAKYQRGAFGNISSAQRQQFQDSLVKFTSCMRQHGVNVPTRTGGTGGPPAVGGRIDQNDPKTKAAITACRSTLPQGGRGGGGPGGAPGGN